MLGNVTKAPLVGFSICLWTRFWNNDGKSLLRRCSATAEALRARGCFPLAVKRMFFTQELPSGWDFPSKNWKLWAFWVGSAKKISIMDVIQSSGYQWEFSKVMSVPRAGQEPQFIWYLNESLQHGKGPASLQHLWLCWSFRHILQDSLKQPGMEPQLSPGGSVELRNSA